jgi:hypothetical protein
MRGKSYPRGLEYWLWGGAFITTVALLAVLSRVARQAIQMPHSTPTTKNPGEPRHVAT